MPPEFGGGAADVGGDDTVEEPVDAPPVEDVPVEPSS